MVSIFFVAQTLQAEETMSQTSKLISRLGADLPIYADQQQDLDGKIRWSLENRNNNLKSSISDAKEFVR